MLRLGAGGLVEVEERSGSVRREVELRECEGKR